MATGAAQKKEHEQMGDNGEGKDDRSNHAAWRRVRLRLRSELGEDVFNSWFSRVDFEELNAGVVRLSAPTRFLKGWIKSHYADRMVQLWKHENPEVRRVDVDERSALRVVLETEPDGKVAEGRMPPAQAETTEYVWFSPSKGRTMTTQSASPPPVPGVEDWTLVSEPPRPQS